MKRIKIFPGNLKSVVKEAKKVIRAGGVIICPTDTVYGLISNAKNEKAVKKIFRIKKRVSRKPIPVFVKDFKMAKALSFINKSQEKFLKKVWPGKVTAVLSAKSKKFPKGILSKGGKIGMRIPDYKLINILLKKLKIPLTGTSANISRMLTSTRIKDILKQFKNQKYLPDLILDAGNLKLSLPSTVIDLESFKILRKGEFPKRKVLKILNKIKK